MRIFVTSLLARNIAWVLSGSILVRLSRIFTTYVLARQLSIEDYGIVAIIVSITQFLNIISISLTKDKLVQCPEKDLADYCQSSWLLQFISGCIIFLLQCIIGFYTGLVVSNTAIVFPIALTALIHLLTPWTTVQLALLQRYQNFEQFSKISNIVLIINNLATAILCYYGFNFWSIPLAWIISIIFQIIFVYNTHIWRPALAPNRKFWKKILLFGLTTSFVEILTKTRESIDYLFVGHFLGLGSLGLYYFAFNSGLGFTLSVSRPLERTVYSEICSKLPSSFSLNNLLTCIKSVSSVIIFIISIQSLLATLYVPFLFGSKWVEAGAVPLLIIICLSGITRLPCKTVCLALRASGKLNIELYWNLIFTAFSIIVLFFSSQVSVLYVSLTVLFLHLLLEPAFMAFGIRFFKSRT